MSEIFVFLIVVITVLVGAVLIVMNATQSTVEDAVRDVKKFLKKIFKALLEPMPPKVITYPVFVGHDGNRFVMAFINEAFAEILATFDVGYCTSVAISENNHCVGYRFTIQQNASADDNLLQLYQKQAEKILTLHMQSYDCYLSAEPLTVVEIRGNELLVAFAYDAEGIRQLDALKRRIMYRQMRKKCSSSKGEFKEKW